MLIVDDQVFNLIVLENLISASFPNAKIEKAMNGKIALETVEQKDREAEPFDMIFMDINMPEMDGIESTRSIKQRFNTGNLT